VTIPTRKVARYFVCGCLLLMMMVGFASGAWGQNTISTVAGSAAPNNVAPTAASIEGPVGVVRDPSGNLYVLTDSGVVYKVTIPPTGAPSTLVIFAGNTDAGPAKSGIQATAAKTSEPDGGALDANGNFYFADGGNCVIREVVASTGIINTVVGNGTCGFSGDNGPATSAELAAPQGIAFDGSGNLYIADINNNRIRRVDGSTKFITTYAGTGAQGFTGDNGPATSATFGFPEAVATDANGNLFIADSDNNVIRRVDVETGIITTVVGTGAQNYSGDGGPATAATMQIPGGIVVDASENLYIADSGNAVIRKVTAATGIINTIVGVQSKFGFGGDGGPALSASLTNPFLLAVDSTTGNVWIPDYWNNRVRMYTASSGTITTVVGNGLVGDGGPATSASLYDPRSPILDSQGNLYIVDATNNRIRKVDTPGNISTVAGNGIPCPDPQVSTCGDGGSATSASLGIPRTVTIDPSGNLIIADSGSNRIREVTDGNITTIAGTGSAGFSGDGEPATGAELNDPRGVVLDSNQNMYFVDAGNNRVRRIDATTHDISTIAGNGPDGNAPSGCQGQGSYSGDGGPAISATLNCPLGLDIDSKGNLFVSDTQNNRIRRIDAVTQIITTVAGNGTAGFSGDGGAATSAMLNNPDRISINAAGNFFISDTNNERIRRVDGTTGIITTFAGNGNFGFAGDGGPAVSASFSTPTGVVVTSQGNMYVGDLLNNRIRLVLLNPNITLSSTTAAFANQALNVSASLTFTVTNSGDAPLTISGVAITSGAFSISSNACPLAPSTLAVGAKCGIDVAFEPTQFIAYTGTITISDNGPTAGSTQNIALSGMGAAALTVTTSGTGTGTVTSSPAGINCPTTCTGTFAGNGQVVLTATAGTGSTFTSFSTNCVPASPQTSPPSCTVSTATSGVTVTATFGQTAPGTITITPSPLPFGLEGLGSTSSPETLTVSNTGNTAVRFTSIAMTGDFAGATLAQCPSIAVDAKPCTFQITFTPTAAGARTGTITFTDNATGSPQTVTLSGTGVAVAIGIAPTALTFGSQAVGTTSTAQTVTVSNNGNFPLIFSSIVTSGDFAGATLAQCPSIGEENPPCVFSITFKPTATGTRTGAITFTDTGTGSPQTVTLTGTGTPGTATVTVTPSSLAFGSQALTTTSAPLSVTVINTSTGPVNFAGFTTSGADAEDFSVPLPNTSSGCSPMGTLAAGASCTINVLFTPQANGARAATLLIADNATGSPQTVALSGTGVTSQVIIAIAPGGSSSATTVSGGTAFYGLTITGAPGVTGTVQLGCIPSSVLITCKVIPVSVTLNGGSTEAAFAIQTFCQGTTTSTGLVAPGGGIGGGLGLLLVSMVFGGAMWMFRRNRRVALTFATLLLVALGSAACSNSLPQGPNGATPAGTYSLSLTTTLNGQTQTLNNFLTLVVK
jgi:sugar lactone lactonase YvrE